MYLFDRQLSGQYGEPQLVPRCASLELTVPDTYDELEAAVRKWIATCVMSRTEVGGEPIRRERGLVNGNATLLDIWNRILKHRKGQRTKILAEYIWGPNRVESIRFSTTATPPPVPKPTPKPAPPPFDRAGCLTFCDENKVCCGRRTRMGGLQCQTRWQTCKENCERGRRWHFPDTDCIRGGPERAFLGEPAAAPAGPRFRFECPPGCAPAAANQCRNLVARAVRQAIQLANDAAAKLEANPRDAETVRLFTAFFGHNPSRPVPWAGNTESGLVVAKRFRKCASELNGGRVMRFRCVTAADCTPTTNAFTNGATSPVLISLCPRFFNRPAGLPPDNQTFRAAVILHEMLHLLFNEFFHHEGHPSGDPERRRDNSHCYEAFALRVNGHGVEPGDRRACQDRDP